VLEHGRTAAIGDREVQLFVGAQLGERDVVDGPGHGGSVDDVDRERAREPFIAAREGFGHGYAGRRRSGDAERRGRCGAVDGERVVRAVLALRKGARARGEENDGRSREGPSEETHIPKNAPDDSIVAIRPMRRADVDAFAAWARHADPLFNHYNLPALTPATADELWAFLSGTPAERRAYAGVLNGQVVATLVVRDMDPATSVGELGIMLDPAYLGQGLGRRILGAFVTVLANEGFRRLHLEVAGYNRRAIAAYLACGFTACDEYWADPEPGIDIEALLDGPAADTVSENVRLEPDGRYRARTIRMERRLNQQMKDDLPT
jgi:RimJ/RimL family protein N-acetyltransferase